MCGRFTLTYPYKELLAVALGVPANALDGWEPRYNIAPTQGHFILRAKGEDRELVPATWGLVNSWALDASRAASAINARAETLSERPMFREGFARRRCIIPADGFYEWEGGARDRRPFWFHRPDGGLLYLAGIFDFWTPPGGPPQCTFTIITTTANETVGRLHDRMPVILDEMDADEWLFERNPAEKVRALLRPAPAGWLEARAVSNAVNSVARDGARLLEPAAEQARLF